MKAVLDAAGRSSRGTTCTHGVSEEQATLGAADLVGNAGTEPEGWLVAGRYRLRSILGHGGMGRVWHADDEVLDRPVALKQFTLSDHASDKTRKVARVHALNEARAAARVDHIGAIKIHDVVREDDGCPWIVMEMLSGQTLAEALKAAGPLPIDQVTSLGLDLLDVLQATHRAGIVHRDVKPANVFLCDDARVVLTDFGVARDMGDGSRIPDGELAGSPAYISPEQLHHGEAGPPSDLFSLGATLFAAVENRAPFEKGGDLFATLTAVLEDSPAFQHAGPLRPVIEGLLAKDPARRLSADQARAALRSIKHERPMPPTDASRIARWHHHLLGWWKWTSQARPLGSCRTSSPGC